MVIWSPDYISSYTIEFYNIKRFNFFAFKVKQLFLYLNSLIT